MRKIIGIGIKALGDFHAFKKAMLADEAPVETLDVWNPDAETTSEDDIPDMPKTVYVMKDAGSVLKSEKPETEDAESVPETEDAESVPETENAESVTETEKPETEAAQSVAETPDAADKAASVAETPDAQADTGDAPEAVETRTKTKGVPRKHPANKKTDKKGSRKPRKVALKPRNGKES